jgi:translation elongation factor EF-1beta
MKNIENLEKKNKNKKVMPSQDLAISDELAKKVHDIIDNKLRTSEIKPERKPIGFPIPGSEKSSSETAKEKGKEKAEEVKKQEAPAATSKKVNASVKNKK